MSTLLFLEVFAVVTGILFLILLIRQNIWCWLFGILSSTASVFLFYYTKLYSESILYIFYIIIGFYGWRVWHRKSLHNESVKTVSSGFHLIAILVAVICSFLLGLFFKSQTDAERSFADAGSTVFSFLASYMEAHKILSAWLFWIAINAFSFWLYLDRGLKLYASLMLVYFVLSIFGYYSWKRSMNIQS